MNTLRNGFPAAALPIALGERERRVALVVARAVALRPSEHEYRLWPAAPAPGVSQLQLVLHLFASTRRSSRGVERASRPASESRQTSSAGLRASDDNTYRCSVGRADDG